MKQQTPVANQHFDSYYFVANTEYTLNMEIGDSFYQNTSYCHNHSQQEHMPTLFHCES